MTTAKPSRWVREPFLDGLAEPSPFEKVEHQTFLKYDRVTIEFKGGLLVASFFWNGKPVFTLSPECGTGEILNIYGIEGRMAINVSN